MLSDTKTTDLYLKRTVQQESVEWKYCESLTSIQIAIGIITIVHINSSGGAFAIQSLDSAESQEDNIPFESIPDTVCRDE